MSHRVEVLAEQFRQVIGEALLFEMRDPSLDSVTITRVKVSPDLQFVDIRFTSGGDEEEARQAEQALNGAAGAFKRIITRKIKLRRVPNLRFHIDDDMVAEERIGRILKNLNIPDEEGDET